MSKKSSEAGRILAQSCGIEKFRALQRAKVKAFWSSPDGKRRKKEMSEHPIRLKKDLK
jgi:hypothetical protein